MVLAILGAADAYAAEPIRIGFVTSLTGNVAHRADDFTEGFKLGLKNLGGRLGGLEVDLTLADDQSMAENAVIAAKRLIERERVHVISGSVTPETTQAVGNAIKGEGPIFISPAFGPVDLAGAGCRMGFFSLVPSDEGFAEALSNGFNAEAVRPLAALGPRQAEASRQVATLFISFQPDVALHEAEPGQLAFDATLSALRSAKSRGIVVFQGGGAGVGFLRQLHRWNMKDGKTVFAAWPLLEPAHFSALGEAGLGVRSISPWADDPDNPVNKKFVADFEDEHRRQPSSFAALGYDLALLLDQAIRQQGGRVGDRTQLARAIAAVQVPGTRGLLRFYNNHFAATPLFLREGSRDPKGRLVAGRKATLAVLPDRHSQACPISAPEPPAPEPPKKR